MWSARIFLLTLALLATAPAAHPAPQVPAEFEDLFAELSRALKDFRLLIDQSWDGTKAPVAFSANVLSAMSSRGPGLLAPGAHDSVAYELDGLQALGVTAVTLDISFPMLYAPFHGSQEEYQRYLEFYDGVAADIRARGLKLIVETQALFSEGGYTYWDVAPYYAGLTLEQYQQGRMEVARAIALNVRPDYLSVIREPDSEAEQTGKTEVGTAAGSAALLDVILSGLQAAGVQGVAVGAGIGTWQSDHLSFVHNFASRPIDYVDMHMYPVNRDYLVRAVEIADIAASYGKQVAMSETWLFKVRDSELDVIHFSTVYGRDVFDFWAPLDALHLQTMVDLAHFKRFAFMSPFWSGYFRGYIAYNESTQDLPPPELNTLAQEKQITNILKGAYSASGLAYKNAIVDPVDVTPPTAPPNLVAQLLTPTSVVLTWSPSPDNVGSAVYVVLRDGVARARTAAPNFSDSGLSDARAYVYQVVAFDTSFNSSDPASVTVTTPDMTPPSTPTNLAAVATLAGSQIDILVSWAPATDNVGVSNYLVYRGTSPDSLSVIGTSATNSFPIVNAPPETTFYFAVSAVDGVRHSSPQSEAAGVATPAIPDITAPTVNIGYPAEGARVSGTTYLYAAAYDVRGGTFDVPSGPAGVQFEIDGINVGPDQTVPYSSTDEYSVYRLSWDTKRVDEGNHVITAVLRDQAGNVARSAGVTVRVDNR